MMPATTDSSTGNPRKNPSRNGDDGIRPTVGPDGKSRTNVCPGCGRLVTFTQSNREKSTAVGLLIRVFRPGRTTTTFRATGLYGHRGCLEPLVSDEEEP